MTRQPPKRWMPAEDDAWDGARQELWWQALGRDRWERGHIKALADMRNSVAHPTLHHVASPVDSIRALDELARFFAVLWLEVATSAAAE